MTSWDHETDLLVVGSGGAGMTAALVAKLEGMNSLVLEKTGRFGGSTALSGGGIWIPNNHLMEQAAIFDSIDNARLYMQNTVGDRVPKANQEAFISRGREMIEYLTVRADLKFSIMPGFPDYYPERPGGAMNGRGITIPVFPGRKIGSMLSRLRWFEYDYPEWIGFTIYEFKKMFLCKANPAYLFTTVKAFLRNIFGLISGIRYVTMGRSVAANLFFALQNKNVPLWLNAGVKGLIVEDGRVVGAEIEKDGQQMNVRAKKGVVLAAGGFPRNKSMREKYLKGSVETTGWTLAANGNTGDAIRMGMALGAAVDLMDDAWWGPVIIPTNEPPLFMLMERAYPGGIFVNSAGERFTNEAASYVDAVHDMCEKNREDAVTIPAHFIIDHRFRSKYIIGLIPPGWTPKKFLESGYIKKADTLEALAEKAGIEPAALVSTVKRFNTYAVEGKDPDFKRGESAYDRFYGDLRVKPNPNLGPIEKPPFYAVNVYPGDIGTKGGLVTNEHAQVLRTDGTVIKGLYAAGNTSASVMGNTYPGPGSTLGPAMTFGYIAAKDAAQQKNS